MGKRSNFERSPKDFYRTPEKAVLPLLPFIENLKLYIEPCAGDGALIDILSKFDKKCCVATDIEPQREDIQKFDIFSYYNFKCDIITNPPWDRKILHPILTKIINNKTDINCWMLFDADWMHIKGSSEYMKYCHKIVSVGRVMWFPETKMTGKDNCAWYLFKNTKALVTQFIGR
jgi:hypothetical protein